MRHNWIATVRGLSRNALCNRFPRPAPAPQVQGESVGFGKSTHVFTRKKEVILMSSNFKKLAIAAGVTAAMAGISAPTQAKIMGAAGEALLVPLVVYATPSLSGYYREHDHPCEHPWRRLALMTYRTSSSIPTARRPTRRPLAVQPTSSVPTLTWPRGFTGTGSIFAAFTSWTGRLPVTANGIVTINWCATQDTGDTWDGVPGYMVIGTEIARRG